MPCLCKSCLLALVCLSPGLLAAQNSVGEVFASDAAVKGSVVLVGGGTQVLSGSQVAAGASSALLRLKRGGDVRICPGTELSVATSPEGNALMLSLSNGSIETNYSVNAVADTVLTPDFKMQMIGPGVFHLAVASDPRGDTCVRPLEQNTASVIVTELMGTGTYQVKPGEQVVFRAGKITGAQHTAMEGCGCPPPPPVQRAETKPEEKSDTLVAAAQAPDNSAVQMDAPFVFRGEDTAPPETAFSMASLTTRDTNSLVSKLQPSVLPPSDGLSPRELKRAEEAKARELAKQREAEKRDEEKRAKEAAQLAKVEREEQKKRDREAARMSAAQKVEQAKKDKEAALQAEAQRKEQARQAAVNARAAEKASREQARKDKEDARRSEIATKEQQKRDQAAARQQEIARLAQAKKDKEALQQAERAKAAQLKQDAIIARKQAETARKQKVRDEKLAKIQAQKQQQARAIELASLSKTQARQEQEKQREAELSRQREQQAAKAEQKRAQETARAQQAAVKAESKAEQKTEPSVIKKIGSFFGKLFRS